MPNPEDKLIRQAARALQKRAYPTLIPVALELNACAGDLDSATPEGEARFAAIKNQVAEIYNAVGNHMGIPNAKLLAVLYHIQAGAFDRASKLARFLEKQAKREKKNKFLDDQLVRVVHLLSLKQGDQARKELRALGTRVDPQVKDLLDETVALVRSKQKD